MKKIFVILALVLFSLVHSEIIETFHFSTITDHVTPKTLIILDIDDTLLIPVQALGTDAWFMYRHQLHKHSGLSPDLALDKALAEWEAIRHLTTVKIVEEGSERIVSQLQNDNYVVMGLTTQGLALATRTVNQLFSLNIDLTKTAPCNMDHYFLNGEGVLYRKGILFTSGSPKGKALLKFLEIIDFHPQKIVFINDKKTHLCDVEKEVLAHGMEFTGLRYSYSDERVKNFRPDIATIQWEKSSPEHLLSDEEAESILSKKISVN